MKKRSDKNRSSFNKSTANKVDTYFAILYFVFQSDPGGVSSISTKSGLSESGWELSMSAPLHLQFCT